MCVSMHATQRPKSLNQQAAAKMANMGTGEIILWVGRLPCTQQTEFDSNYTIQVPRTSPGVISDTAQAFLSIIDMCGPQIKPQDKMTKHLRCFLSGMSSNP